MGAVGSILFPDGLSRRMVDKPYPYPTLSSRAHVRTVPTSYPLLRPTSEPYHILPLLPDPRQNCTHIPTLSSRAHNPYPHPTLSSRTPFRTVPHSTLSSRAHVRTVPTSYPLLPDPRQNCTHILPSSLPGPRAYGPDEGWASAYPECRERNQSPINIVDHNAKASMEYQELTLEGFDAESSNKTSMKNTGKTAVLRMQTASCLPQRQRSAVSSRHVLHRISSHVPSFSGETWQN
ncbi:hypothetical protein CRUP_011703 [Coryphaenoides rupestris]|nr:hypothetical protein CRUP_011703 [Coryphaenoides rupestris]